MSIGMGGRSTTTFLEQASAKGITSLRSDPLGLLSCKEQKFSLMRLASYVVLSVTCRVTTVTYILVFTMVRMINRHGERARHKSKRCRSTIHT